MLTIVIPARGFPEMTLKCIDSIRSDCPNGYQIVVVDNEGDFNSKGIVRIQGDPGWSFAHSCNVGAGISGDDILFVNNDVFAISDFITPMKKLVGGKIGIVGALLLYPDRRIQHCGSRYNKGNPDHPHKHERLERCPDAWNAREVEGVTFACAYVLRECWEDLGGLDERFLFGYEDIDFCLRARERKWQIYYCPDARLIHKEHITQRKYLGELRKKSDTSIELLRKRWGS